MAKEFFEKKVEKTLSAVQMIRPDQKGHFLKICIFSNISTMPRQWPTCSSAIFCLAGDMPVPCAPEPPAPEGEVLFSLISVAAKKTTPETSKIVVPVNNTFTFKKCGYFLCHDHKGRHIFCGV
jgi:hypothetical protein